MPSSKRSKAQASRRDLQLERLLIDAIKTFLKLGLSEDILRAVFNGAPVEQAIEEARPEISRFLAEHMIESHRVGRSWTYESFARHVTAPRSFVLNDPPLSPGDRVTLPKYVKVAGRGRDFGTVEHAEVVGLTRSAAILRKVNAPEDVPEFGATSDIRVPRKLAERHRDPGTATPRTRIVTNARDLIEIRSAEVSRHAVEKYTNDSDVKSFRLTREVSDAVAEVMARARSTGESLTTTTNMVRAKLESFGISERPHRIETIVRTNNAIASSAGQWSANQDPDIDEILWGYTYVTVGDDRVRPEHAALDGTTLPKDDIFWTRNMPPNGWNCRCSAIEVFTDERREPERPPDVVSVELNDGSFRDVRPGADEGFDFNPGQIVSSGVPLMMNGVRLSASDRVLCALNELGGAASMTDVARHIGINKANVSRQVSTLSRSGLVDHGYGEYITRLTEEGAARAARVLRPVCACC